MGRWARPSGRWFREEAGRILAMEALSHVTAATLLIVGERDEIVLQLNEEAFARLAAEKSLTVVPGTTHLFEEPGALDPSSTVSGILF